VFFLALKDYAITHLDAILIAELLSLNTSQAFDYTWKIGEILNYKDLFNHLRIMRQKNNWDQQACRSMISDFRQCRKRLVFELMTRKIPFKKYFESKKESLFNIREKIDAIVNEAPDSFAPYIVIIQDLKRCIHHIDE